MGKKKYPDRKPKVKCQEPCCICGGPFAVHIDDKPYCNKHYQSMYHYGNPFGSQRKRGNKYHVDGDTVVMETNGGAVFYIDREDLESVLAHTWCFSKTGYLVARVNGKVAKLTRYLLNPPEDKLVDHVDGDTSNNRRSNLRICDSTGNARNIRVQKNSGTGYTGVSKTPEGKYRARITVDRKEIRLGHFDRLDDAVRARKEAEKKYFGEFAPSNCRIEQMSDIQNQM